MKKGLISLLLFIFFLEYSFFPFIFSTVHITITFFFLASIVLVYDIYDGLIVLVLGAFLLEWFTVQPMGISTLSLLVGLSATKVLKQFLTAEPRRSGFIFGGFIIAYCVYVLGLTIFSRLLNIILHETVAQIRPIYIDWKHHFISLILSLFIAMMTYQLVSWQERTWGRSQYDIKMSS